ncbi:hypothetical protein FGRMN_618 [Fusarium graminum]|nr:hypothetical protein FGRMN_618 [Fusarium graminum]
MCEQLTRWRFCTGCQKREGKNGMSYREIDEKIECKICYARRVEDLEADRERRFKEAWPDATKETAEQSGEASQEKNEQHPEMVEDEDVVVL